MPSRNPNKATKSITKVTLYIRAMKSFFRSGSVVIFLMFAMLINVLSFTLGLQGGLRDSLVFGIVVMLMLIILGSLGILINFIIIAKQEEFFGIRFRDEMKKEQISETEYMSKDWFISVRAEGVIVFREGFITRIDTTAKRQSYKIPTASRIVVITADGNRIGVSGYYEAIDNLIKWQKSNLPEIIE